jgi:hypothetical protein
MRRRSGGADPLFSCLTNLLDNAPWEDRLCPTTEVEFQSQQLLEVKSRPPTSFEGIRGA